MELNGLKYLIVGAGFFGSVIAERIASDLGEKVLVIDSRCHIGGNSYSEVDGQTGIEFHKYGSHIFHTADAAVWSYINRFCSFNAYRHKVLTTCGGKVYQMPINLATINEFYGESFTPDEARRFIEAEVAREGNEAPRNLEEKAVSQIGRALYDAFIRGYTAKQWETDPRELPAEIITRLPVRFNYKLDYFNDPWQGIPVQGYGELFRRMLDHDNIEVRLATDFFEIADQVPADCLIVFTGPIDSFYRYRHGALGWRSLRLENEVVGVGDFQGTAVMNYADDAVPYTRIHEFRHYHEERAYPGDRTLICREYSKGWRLGEDPFYPVKTAADQEIYRHYQALAREERNVVFGGRLGSYTYFDMDKVIAQALATYAQRIKPQHLG